MGGAHRIVARMPPSALVILGEPVAQSLSPVFQNAALAFAGIPVHYDRREVSATELDAVLNACRANNCGGNVTMPHKHAVYIRAAHCTPVAQRTGAVNTFWWENGQLVGHNTDVDGIAATIRALCPAGIEGDVVLLGAGGSAAAVLVALDTAVRNGTSRTYVLARTPQRAASLVGQVGVDATIVANPAAVDWSRVALVINATPSGMQPGDALPLDLSDLSSHTAVFDLVYKRDGTRWVHEARARRLCAEDGLRMLVEQGASAFETWFGVPAPRDVMWRALGAPMPLPHAVRP